MNKRQAKKKFNYSRAFEKKFCRMNIRIGKKVKRTLESIMYYNMWEERQNDN